MKQEEITMAVPEGCGGVGRFAAGADPVKRGQILDGAKRVFMKLGYDAASMNDVTREAGVSNDALRHFAGRLPVLGVCLGHQCLGHVYGAEIVRAERILHGKTSQIIHQGRGLFAGLPNPFSATRYHSLLVRRDTLPDVLEVVAWTAEGEIMGLKHRQHEAWGVQFHPESVLTEHGKKLLANFLSMTRRPAVR